MRLDQLLAWRRNEADFDDVPLSDAVAEMNRYSSSQSFWSATRHRRSFASAGCFKRAATSPLPARWLRCTGWLCMIVEIAGSLSRVVDAEEIRE